LSSRERTALQERLLKAGPERVGDVVLDLSAQQLADWLADSNAL